MKDLLEAWRRLTLSTDQTLTIFDRAAAGAAAEGRALNAGKPSEPSSSGGKGGEASRPESRAARKSADRSRLALAAVRAMASEGGVDGDEPPKGSAGSSGSPSDLFAPGPFDVVAKILAERRTKLVGWLQREEHKHWQRANVCDRPYPVPFPGTKGGTDACQTTSDLLVDCDEAMARLQQSRAIFLGL